MANKDEYMTYYLIQRVASDRGVVKCARLFCGTTELLQFTAAKYTHASDVFCITRVAAVSCFCSSRYRAQKRAVHRVQPLRCTNDHVDTGNATNTL